MLRGCASAFRSQSGEVDQATLNELNVPADVRARELEASAKRIADVKIDFDQRYVVVNIPSASVEAVQDRRVAQRHAANSITNRRS
jgi:L,D-transpeptidase YcbB